MNVFYFSLQHTIVQRRDSAGGDYYLNSGSTRQTGAEALLRYKISSSRIVNSFVRLGYSVYSFQYDKFAQLTNDYSGKMMPGTPANTLTAGTTLQAAFGLYWNIDYYFCDRIALNDANTAYTQPYNLSGTRVGYKRSFRRYAYDVFGGINNILNQQYSLGNDINAINGRYYNAAAPVNFYAGVSVSYLK